MRLVFVLSTMALISGCSDNDPLPVRTDPHAKSYPMFSVDMDPQRTMPFDPEQPYRLEFGRGSRLNGLNTVSIDEKGQVVLYRRKEEQDGDGNSSSWETASLSIDTDAVRRIAKLISDLKFPAMNRAYHADVKDGSQWVFQLVQGDQEKHIEFDNVFPVSIQDFAVALDRELQEAGIDRAEWSPVPPGQERDHEKDLWESTAD